MDPHTEYKRTMDNWTKIIAVAAPILAVAATWGFFEATLSNLDRRLVRIEAILDARLRK